MKIIVSAGGTGGHIYPALSIMNALIKRGINEEDIFYIGTTDRMEKDIIPTKFKDFKVACDYAEELSNTFKRAALIADNKILLTTNKMRH